MAPRTKQCKNKAPGTDEPAEKVRISGWERSKISAQYQKTLKKLGLLKKEALKMPGDESSPRPPIGLWVTSIDFLVRGLAVPVHEFLRGLLFIYGIQLHQLTPKSRLHISIFITLCECFLGIHPHWGLWKRIFYLQRNNSRNVIYNVGGVCICVRPDVDYFDIKFLDSVQGWRNKWLYIQDESALTQEYGIAPFDPAEEIQRRKSWDTEATAEEKATTEALMNRIHQLLNTDGEELSGVQIIAYFLRIRVQPLQARKNPLWMYSGAKDVDRFSKDLSVKDLEKLVRRFTSLNKNHEVPSSCRVKPYSANHALPEDHQILSSLPPLPEGGEVDGRVVVTDGSQESSLPESVAVESQKSAGSSEKETGSEQHSESAHSISPPLTTSPDGRKRKRDNVKDSGASKLAETSAEESSPEEEGSSTPSPMLALSAQSVRPAEERANTLEAKLKTSEAARKKAEKEVAAVESLRQRLKTAEDALSNKEARQLERQMCEQYTLNQETDDRLLDALAILELNSDLARTNISSARAALKPIFLHFFPKDTQPKIFSQLTQHFQAKEDPVLAYRQASLKIGVEGTIALVAASGQEVDWVKAGTPKGINKEKWRLW
ncbi:hypothetical protein QYE76_042909 [Lolium multiflorum]|uniref:Transposase (putative) gypsy type domain-containing protein n=1 Tax=Lolium multiflorum TaxID=4521 RepID=A0AAD8TI29_LOLMU|nr:hypothetical protein QYE76_042909 [Lolium multiflorum]